MSDIVDEFIDVEQAARALRCSEYTIRERARKQDLPGVKFGEDWVFPRTLFIATVERLARPVFPQSGASSVQVPVPNRRPVLQQPGG